MTYFLPTMIQNKSTFVRFYYCFKLIIIVVQKPMLRSILINIFRKTSNNKPDANKIGQMADKIEQMNETMNRTSPKIFSIFMMLSTIPTFYFGYKMVTADYHSKQMTTATNAGLMYINVKNTIFFFTLSALNYLKLKSPTAQHTIPRVGMVGTILPPIFLLISLCLPPSDNKFIVFPTLAADLSMVIVEAQAANFGAYPFWLYSYRHFIRFFDWIILFGTYRALSNLQQRIQSHPHEFTEVENKDKTN